MTPERAKELLPVIKAFSEGKAVECRRTPGESWTEFKNGEAGPSWVDYVEYRVKPEPKTPGQILYEAGGNTVSPWSGRDPACQSVWERVAANFLKEYEAQT